MFPNPKSPCVFLVPIINNKSHSLPGESAVYLKKFTKHTIEQEDIRKESSEFVGPAMPHRYLKSSSRLCQ